MSKGAVIELKNVDKQYRLESGLELKVLANLNLQVYEDEVVALLGPSGSGKSTTLRILSGLTDASEGEVLLRGNPIIGTNLEVALVFQSFALLPWESVFDNIALALEPLNLSPNEMRSRVKRIIDLVGLEGFEEAYPRELSGGMKQRVGIARALVMERPILCLDEPFSVLDILTATTFRSELIEIFLDKKTATRSMVLVTHNIQEALSMARRVLIMGTNPGHIKHELINDLPYPRDENSPAFRRLVNTAYGLITQTIIPDDPEVGVSLQTGRNTMVQAPPREAPIESLPYVQIVEMIGLLEGIYDQAIAQGQKQELFADIFDLGHKMGKDFGQVLYMVKGAELLDLVETPKQRVVLTDLGKHFIEGDINVRKRMLHELFGSLKIVQMTSNLLKKDEHLRLPIEALRERVGEWLPNENPEQIVETLVSWGRFSEYFGYSDDTQEVYLDIGQETT